MSSRILLVDPDPVTVSGVRELLDETDWILTTAFGASEAREMLDRDPGAADVVLLALELLADADAAQPSRDGLDLLEEIRRRYPELPVIVVSSRAGVDLAVRATRLGAYDFLEKPLRSTRVLLTLQNALEKARLARQLERLAGGVDAPPLIGSCLAMRQLKEDLERAAASESRLLIVGENGTGKELVARQVHRLSQRSAATFVEVNCAAIPEDLIESELFGHVKGAFTGATRDRAGRFEQADGGTLFLDEIADMSLKTQAKVLRVLQEQRFERVGGTASIQVDVRVLAATNKDLVEEIRQGRFREDLYFRLAVIPLRVPALRERREDIAELVEHFIGLFARELGGPPKHLTPEALARLEELVWPGNVRELRNGVERMMIMVPGEEIQLADLPPELRGESSGVRLFLEDDLGTLRQARSAFEKRYIERRLEQHGGNVSRAAEALGVERSHLHRKMKQLGIARRRAR